MYVIVLTRGRMDVIVWTWSYGRDRIDVIVWTWTGIRDDLLFILDEEISSVMLCSLHCEMRNTEQLLGSVGLFAHKCSALVDFNTTLSSYGPESFKEKRITVKLHPGQESAVEKGNIKVATFSGPTEREILDNLEAIMAEGLPLHKIEDYYKNTKNGAKQVILDRYSFCEYTIEEAKEWGYLLRELFGDRLGSGDYGHLTIEHSSMLFRRFRSFTKYSNQGFEALHRIQRQTYARATNHDSKSPGQSLEDIFLIHYAENLLFFRLSIHQALECYINDKKLYFRGCGWQRAQAPMLSEENSKWLLTIEDLMEKMFGEDYLEYFYDKSTGTHVTEEMFPTYKYNHNTWEEEYDDYFQSDHIQSYFSTTKSVVPIKKRAKKSLFNWPSL
ncbi:hypothetical protein QZH41_005173 [Actinostola sp. cb2023]|nr:hypothetical protein QZH41_005173 [Actinostola sp. cb2023]